MRKSADAVVHNATATNSVAMATPNFAAPSMVLTAAHQAPTTEVGGASEGPTFAAETTATTLIATNPVAAVAAVPAACAAGHAMALHADALSVAVATASRGAPTFGMASATDKSSA